TYWAETFPLRIFIYICSPCGIRGTRKGCTVVYLSWRHTRKLSLLVPRWRTSRPTTVDEVFVRRDVIDAAKLRSLCVPSNIRGAAQAVSHLGAIAVTGTLLWHWRDTWW